MPLAGNRVTNFRGAEVLRNDGLTREQIGQGRLARTRRANQRDALALGNLQLNSLEHVAVVVTEMDVVEMDRALERGQLDRARPVGNRPFLVEHREDPHRGGP